MTSQTDLDQGGTFRQFQRVFMGPSVGYLLVPQQALFPIIAAGAYSIARGTNLITIAANGNVTVNLPSSKAAPQGPQAIPGQWYLSLVTVADVAGFAGANVYTINPAAGE